ncbi:Lsr2 family protein [Kribbella sp. NPDC059898]|uniref:histone-like nucleoid-structuring protein Lsr2 n=1 Tax=Kribbella sp. NPDC059898 TaxID=3346995 RepID=UPI003647B1F5
MVQRTTIRLTDDLDGSDIPAGKGQTVQFALDGASYEIDLKTKHEATLRRALQPFIAAGRRSAPSRRGPRRSAAEAAETRRIKAWARENGYQVADRGRVSRRVREAYNQAN